MSTKIQIEYKEDLVKPKLRILCVDITYYSKVKQFILCSTAVFGFFIIYGLMQELIFTITGFAPYGWYLTLVQFAFYSMFGLFEQMIKTGCVKYSKIPIQNYALLALLTLGTMGFSNTSLGYLNYPTQVIFKCCKLIPVMAGSVLIQGKFYGPLNFLAALFMCLGLIFFTLADSEVSPNYNPTGIMLISLALVCDAVIGNVQEKSMKKYGASNTEVVLYSYAIGFLYLFIVMLVSGDLFNGWIFFYQDPLKLYGYTLVFSITGYLGTQIVLTLVCTCGAFAAVTVTTCRKAVTIIFSFIFFSKPFTFHYVTSGLLIVFGIYLNMYSKKYSFNFGELMRRIKLILRLPKQAGRFTSTV